MVLQAWLSREHSMVLQAWLSRQLAMVLSSLLLHVRVRLPPAPGLGPPGPALHIIFSAMLTKCSHFII